MELNWIRLSGILADWQVLNTVIKIMMNTCRWLHLSTPMLILQNCTKYKYVRGDSFITTHHMTPRITTHKIYVNFDVEF